MGVCVGEGGGGGDEGSPTVSKVTVAKRKIISPHYEPK